MKIEENLKQVSDYFKEQIIAGEFEIVGVADCTATIMIDGKYQFGFWIANTPELHFDTYNVHENYSIIHFETPDERRAAFDSINSRIRDKQKQYYMGEIESMNKKMNDLEK